MTSPNWQVIPGFSKLQWAETGNPGVLFVRDLRKRIPGEPFETVRGQDGLTYWVAEHSRSDSFVPFGDWIATVATKLGFKTCVPCAKRRAYLNSLLPKF